MIVAAVHGNHPMHGQAAGWLDSALGEHEVVVSHHSVVEAYAVLTRLPAPYRVSPTEALEVLRGSLRGNVEIAEFSFDTVWSTLDRIGSAPAAGAAAYDAFIAETLRGAAADAVVTYNVRDFRRIAGDLRILHPSDL